MATLATDRLPWMGEDERLRRLLEETAKAVPYEMEATTGLLTYIGPQVEDLLGFPAERWLEEGFLAERIHPDDRDRALEACRRRSPALGELAFELEFRLVAANGRVLWVRQLASAFPRSGRPERVRGFFVDITERKQREISLEEALRRIEELNERLRAENVLLRSGATAAHDVPEEVVGRSDAWKRVLGQAKQVAASQASVLLLGETGTGKEVVARAIHRLSPRHAGPFVAVSCAALPATLVESELFGHEKGAFTGAVARKIGRFELAEGGTLFLDEIGDLAADIQTKLLRVLQFREVERLGSGKPTKVDVRVIAATHRDLERAVAEERFRADLYYRLMVFPMRLPPLRDRRDDIPLLITHFAQLKGRPLGKKIQAITPAAMTALSRHPWPGNVRELENAVERALILATGPSLGLDEFAFLIPDAASAVSPAGLEAERMETVERAHLLRVLERSGWRINGAGNAASRLGLNPSTLRSRMKKLRIARPESGPG